MSYGTTYVAGIGPGSVAHLTPAGIFFRQPEHYALDSRYLADIKVCAIGGGTAGVLISQRMWRDG